MKKVTLAFILAAILPTGAFAQGTVNFANNVLPGTVSGIYDEIPVNPHKLPAGSYTVALYWDSTATSAGQGIDPTSAFLTVEKIYTSNPSDWPFAGQFAGGTVTINGLAPGATGYFEVVAWTGSFSSFSAAVIGNAEFAYTPLFANTTGGAGSPPGTPLNLTGWSGNLDLAIPEPSTMALAGLGTTILILLRRRK